MVLQESLCHEAIGSLLGATMAQSTASMNDQYSVGLKKVSKVVQDMVVYQQDGQEYISYDVNLKLHELYQVCHSAIFINSVKLAKECVHQAFQFEQDEKYPPQEHPESAELNHNLKNCLKLHSLPCISKS